MDHLNPYNGSISFFSVPDFHKLHPIHNMTLYYSKRKKKYKWILFHPNFPKKRKGLIEIVNFPQSGAIWLHSHLLCIMYRFFLLCGLQTVPSSIADTVKWIILHSILPGFSLFPLSYFTEQVKKKKQMRGACSIVEQTILSPDMFGWTGGGALSDAL